MSRTSIGLNLALSDYLREVGYRDHPLLSRLRDETRTMAGAGMQISPEQGALMQLLVEIAGIRRYLEIGVFTGYSALAVALALPKTGKITACDIDPETTAVARRYWAEAGVSPRVDLRLAPATETLAQLLRLGMRQSYDLAFIDADKDNYDAYYEACMELVRKGGLIAIDNMLWGGRVIDAKAKDADTEAIRALNRKIHGDKRVSFALLPIGDGLTLVRKR
jgi:caffeoyl-CoA O-methyltransferase